MSDAAVDYAKARGLVRCDCLECAAGREQVPLEELVHGSETHYLGVVVLMAAEHRHDRARLAEIGAMAAQLGVQAGFPRQIRTAFRFVARQLGAELGEQSSEWDGFADAQRRFERGGRRV